MRRSSPGRRVLQRQVEVRHHRRAARASWRRAGPSPRSGTGRAAARVRSPYAPSRSSRRRSGASAPGSPTSRPYQARSCATSTISAAPRLHERRDLRLDRLRRPRPLRPAERRDGAERARAVAALGDLHVRPRCARRGSGELEEVAHAGGLPTAEHDVDERALVGEAHHRVGLGERGRELVAVALGHAAGDHQPGAGPLRLGETERDVDRLLARRVDEGAGVDDHEVGVAGASAGTSPSASSVATTLSESTAFFGQPSVST